MRKKRLIIFLIIEALCCVLWHSLGLSGAAGITAGSLFTFPFAQIGDGLRALSLSGTVGNIAAIILYILFCGSPLLVLLGIHRKRKVYPEDGLLAGLSVMLFFAMYLMINPGLISGALGSQVGAAGTGKAVLSVVLYSVLVGYLVLRVLRRSRTADMEKLQNYFNVILYLLGVVFIWGAFGVGLGELRSALTELAAGNTAYGDSLFGEAFFGSGLGGGLSGGSLGLSRAFLVIRYVTDALPYLLDTVIVLTGLDLLEAMKENRYGEETLALARKLSGQCVKFLSATVLCNLIFNVLQLIFLKNLLVVNATVQLPVLSILFVLIVLFLTKMLTENKELKDDNDLFV